MLIRALGRQWELRSKGVDPGASDLKNPLDWLLTLVGVASSKSGVRVSNQGALAFSAVYACVRVIAEGVSSLPLMTYERVDGGKRRVADHPVYYLLHTRPNPRMTAMVFRETLQYHVLNWGNFYAYIERDSRGRIVGLWPLLPDRTYPEIRDGIHRYLTNVDGEQRILRPWDVLHVPGLGFDGLVGYNPIRLWRDVIGVGLAAEEFGARFFAQGANVGGFLEAPLALKPDTFKRLKESMTEFEGLDNAHRIRILEEGLKFNRRQIPPNEAQFIETRKFQVNEICRIYRVPPHMIGDLDRATFSNIEQQSIEFVVQSLRPWLVRWEQELNAKLFTEAEQARYYVEHNVEGLLRGDTQSRYTAYATARQNGWLSANDIRRLENMDPLPDSQGDLYLVPLNMQPASWLEADRQQPGGQNNPAAPTPEAGSARAWERRSLEELRNAAKGRSNIANAYRRLLDDAARRVVKRECNDLRRALDKERSRRDAAAFRHFVEDYYRDFPEFIRQQMEPVMQSLSQQIADAASDEIGTTNTWSSEVERFCRDYLDTYTTRYCGSSRGQLLSLMDGDLPYDAVEQRLGEWEERKPAKAADNESIRLSSAVAIALWALAGIRAKRWYSHGETSCPYCRDMDGKLVSIESPFQRSGDSLSPDGAEPMQIDGDKGHPPLHEGCVCTVLPS